MADTIESLELEISYKSSDAASKIAEVTSAIRKLSNALEKVIPNLKLYKGLMGDTSFNVNNYSTINVADTIQNIQPAAEKAKAATKEASKGIREMGKAASKATNPLANFVSSIKRIAFYRFIRSIIKGITEGFQEGLKNAYEYSKTINGDLATALDTLKTKSLTMKNQLGAAFGGLITALAPVIQQVISLITQVANAITRLIAILSGKSTWMRAKDVWTEWGDDAKKAGKSAKEALKYLAPFDEINRLSDENSGSGGSGSDTPDYANMFETVSTEIGDGLLDTFKGIFDKIHDFFDGKNWVGLGSGLWDKVKEVFSDDSKATECVDAFFRALGSAFGAVLGTAWGFIKSAAEDVIENFNKNIRDYNGDDKITVIDILAATFKTGGELVADIIEWIADHIVGPFFEGLIDAFDTSENNEKSKEVGRNVMDGLIKGMKLFYDDEGKFTLEKLFNLIIILAKFIFGEHSPSKVFEEIGSNLMLGLLNGLRSAWESIALWVEQKFGWLISWCKSAIGWLGSVRTGIDGVNQSSAQMGLHSGHSGTFAEGGFPSVGQMFIARESGPEMVGTIGGHTAVANNDQIVEGIRAGVYDAVVSAMSNNSNSTPIPVEIDGRRLAEILYPYNKMANNRHGTSLINA